jgi:hypothetical protein
MSREILQPYKNFQIKETKRCPKQMEESVRDRTARELSNGN